MILTSRETEPEITYWTQTVGYAVSDNTAQTIASWWYSPGAPAMVEFVTTGNATDRDALYAEVQAELDALSDDDPGRTELRALLAWVERQRRSTR